MSKVLRLVAIVLVAGIATDTYADFASDRKAFAHLSDTATVKEPAALAAYKARDSKVAAQKLEELREIYTSISELQSLSQHDRRYWQYMLLIVNARLTNVYEWSGESAKADAATRQAIRYSRDALSKPLSSRRAIKSFIAGVDKKL